MGASSKMTRLLHVIAPLLLCYFLLLTQAAAADNDDEATISSKLVVRAGDVFPVAGNLYCGAACSRRCSLSKRPNLCQRACGSCCQRCNCVPPGTSGNYPACPCYASLTTRGNRHKCP